MEQDEVLILAATYMHGGVCLGGIRRSTRTWIRPLRSTRPDGMLQRQDLRDRHGNWMKCFDVVRMRLVEPCPRPPHSEDWAVDVFRERPAVVRAIPEQSRARVLAEFVEASPEAVLAARDRSLGLMRPAALTSALFDRCNSHGNYEVRLGFTLGFAGSTESGPDASQALPGEAQRQLADTGPAGWSVTDLKLRAFGRRLLTEAGAERLTLSGAELLERLGAIEVFLAIGLSRPYRERYWPLVVGVHTLPDYEATIDYQRL